MLRNYSSDEGVHLIADSAIQKFLDHRLESSSKMSKSELHNIRRDVYFECTFLRNHPSGDDRKPAHYPLALKHRLNRLTTVKYVPLRSLDLCSMYRNLFLSREENLIFLSTCEDASGCFYVSTKATLVTVSFEKLESGAIEYNLALVPTAFYDEEVEVDMLSSDTPLLWTGTLVDLWYLIDDVVLMFDGSELTTLEFLFHRIFNFTRF
mmetsp:Transcript_73873/g.159791  ORF Transcript_73873/g.159791 Transcript_73873/m.159791 type:complete len:208 (+) Transcript_73873:295-918(+)